MDNRSSSASILVNRSPETLYALVSDITRMGEWSPVCTGCWWESDARGVGAWFVGRNDNSQRVWETRSQIAVDEPGREIAWIVDGNRTRWGYTFEAVDGGTLMTESWDLLPAGDAYFAERYGDEAEAQVAIRFETANVGMPQTLAAIKKSAEADS